MSNFTVTIDNCDLEPIHIPGQIQAHGFLVVTDQHYIITFSSENVIDFLQVAARDLLGQPLTALEDIIAYKNQPGFIANILQFAQAENFEQTNPFEFKLADRFFNLIISRSTDYLLLEFEPAGSKATLDIQNKIGRSIANMLGDKNLSSLLYNSAIQIKNIIGYDRIMIYKFAKDGHGEVVSEAKNEELSPWLGLHYPASDIPPQARELYKKNLTRLIANVEDQPSKIISAKAEHHDLDLTNGQLRAVSPVHIQYLKNMGVASSFSISLMYKGELWGLIACHSYTPRFIDFKSRESAKLIGQILSSALEFRQDEEDQQIIDGYSKSIDKLAKFLNQEEDIVEALFNKETNLLNVSQATGVVYTQGNKIYRSGITPDNDQLAELLKWVQESVYANVFHTDHLSSIFSPSEAYKELASGLLICTVSKELSEYFFWFKPEIVQTIKWAGDPSKPFEFDTTGNMQISPRHSFDLWLETVHARSEKWSNEEIKSIKQLRDEIIYSINQKANMVRIMNEKLKLAYDELDTFSYTISHDLKNPLAIIKTYAQLLSRDGNMGDRSLNFLTRIDNGADRMNSMISEVLDYSRIGRAEVQYAAINTREMMMEIIADLKVIYDSANLHITIGNTPQLQGEHTMLAQVFSNLIGNAVKYSQHAVRPEVFIEGRVNENDICYSIKDNGIGIDPNEHHKLFELFKRMDNVKEIEGSGVGLAIVKRIVDKHQGKIWVESEIGKGATFYVSFKRVDLLENIECA